jgi:hypothetical protein
MSKIEVNQVDPQSGTTLTLGTSGDTISIPAGVTLANSGTATGFASIAWQSVQTTGFTAVAGNGYFCNTTSAGFTVTLPATPSAGDQVQLVDYAGTFDTNALVINPNGNKIEGGTDNLQLGVEREGATLTYIDSTQGWLATSGINEGTDALSPESYSIDFLVIGGGGSGGRDQNNGTGAGGGGAGGFRTSTQNVDPSTTITITVGDGGASQTSNRTDGNNGSSSSISGTGLTTITSAGGGGGGAYNGGGQDGGSGGGAYGGGINSGGSGNTPSTSPSQGNDGGDVAGGTNGAAGGGGAGASGSNGTASSGNGGNGTASSITGSSVTRAGGGGGSNFNDTGGTGGTGGGGDGGDSSTGNHGVDGTANTGSGGGGGGCDSGDSGNSGAGGKGVVILSMPDAKYSGTTTGSPTVATGVSGKTVLTFTGSGSYTA